MHKILGSLTAKQAFSVACDGYEEYTRLHRQGPNRDTIERMYTAKDRFFAGLELSRLLRKPRPCIYASVCHQCPIDELCIMHRDWPEEGDHGNNLDVAPAQAEPELPQEVSDMPPVHPVRPPLSEHVRQILGE